MTSDAQPYHMHCYNSQKELQNMAQDEYSFVTPDQLRVGLYVYLDVKWFEHPFAFNHFKIKDEEQIRVIRSLGIKQIRYDPARSDAPLAAGVPEQVTNVLDEPTPVPDAPKVAAIDLEYVQAVAAKQVLIDTLRQQREVAARVDAAFLDTAKTMQGVELELLSRPRESIDRAIALVGGIADSILSASDLAIQVMGDQADGEPMYFHSLNVAMLSLMVARDIGLPPETARLLGLGALFHDIGCREIPERIMTKMEPLTPDERAVFETHCQRGWDLGHRLKLPSVVLTIIHEHHEMVDGSGYPRKLQGDQLDPLTRIVSIANYYDELCNPVNVFNAQTPHEALATMFAKLRGRFDAKLMQTFVRCLGVYPPGTIVQLSNDAFGMVVTVNTAKPMKPMVLIYDASVPKEDAILVDLDSETGVNIAKAIRPAQLSREIYSYLSPRRKVSYYFDAGVPENKGSGR